MFLEHTPTPDSLQGDRYENEKISRNGIRIKSRDDSIHKNTPADRNQEVHQLINTVK